MPIRLVSLCDGTSIKYLGSVERCDNTVIVLFVLARVIYAVSEEIYG